MDFLSLADTIQYSIFLYVVITNNMLSEGDKTSVRICWAYLGIYIYAWTFPAE